MSGPVGRWAILAVLACVAGWVWWRALEEPARLRVTVLDVGQGDSAVIETPGGHVLVVDAGPRAGQSDAGRRIVVPFLRSRGYNGIDALVLTHPDEDHVGGAQSVLGAVRVARLVTNGDVAQTDIWRATGAAASRAGVRVTAARAGDRVDLHDGVVLWAVAPLARPETADQDPVAPNGHSTVWWLTYGQTSLLLMADADNAVERDMAARYPNLRADVLKVAHHGSRFGTSAALLSCVRPRLAVVSVGEGNRFGHPAPVVLGRLNAAGVRVYRTDRNGGVRIESDGRSLGITPTVPAPMER